MPSIKSRHPARSALAITYGRSDGFSLLEMVVAIAILALSLGVMYQAASGATRNVRSDERYAYGVEMARTLLADHSVVPNAGIDAAGKTSGDFEWSVLTSPVELPDSGQDSPSLHNIQVSVSWPDGSKFSRIVLASVVEGRSP